MTDCLHNAEYMSLPSLPKRQRLIEPELTEGDRQRFWQSVHRRGPQECWLWHGSTLGGNHGEPYGQFTVTVAPRTQAHLYAHRVAWILAHGPIPKGLSVLHRCDTPLCMNAAHFFLGTHADNMHDAARKGRLHVVRPKNHKVTTEQLGEIDALLASGDTQVSIARRYSVSKTWVSLYAKGQRRQYDRLQAGQLQRSA